MEKVQIKSREIKEWRDKLLEEQGGVCPLCSLEIDPTDAALDHCYDTGHIRAVLHRSCNGAEGQIKKWAGQRSKGKCHTSFIENLLAYWKSDYSDLPIHPKYGKPVRRKRRRRKK